MVERKVKVERKRLELIRERDRLNETWERIASEHIQSNPIWFRSISNRSILIMPHRIWMRCEHHTHSQYQSASKTRMYPKTGWNEWVCVCDSALQSSSKNARAFISLGYHRFEWARESGYNRKCHAINIPRPELKIRWGGEHKWQRTETRGIIE